MDRWKAEVSPIKTQCWNNNDKISQKLTRESLSCIIKMCKMNCLPPNNVDVLMTPPTISRRVPAAFVVHTV